MLVAFGMVFHMQAMKIKSSADESTIHGVPFGKYMGKFSLETRTKFYRSEKQQNGAFCLANLALRSQGVTLEDMAEIITQLNIENALKIEWIKDPNFYCRCIIKSIRG